MRPLLLNALNEHYPPPKPRYFLALVKDAERYVFFYDDESKPELLRTLGRLATTPDLSFTWYGAALLSQKIRQGVDQVIGGKP